MKVFCVLGDLALTNSRLEKERILHENKDNEVLKRCFELAYSPFYKFWLKADSLTLDYSKCPMVGILRDEDLMEAIETYLMPLYTRKLTGDAAREHIENNMLKYVPVIHAKILINILNKDLRVGVAETSINKVWNGLIPVCQMMLADTDMKKIRFPAYAQEKADGTRVHAVFRDGKVLFLTRNNNTIDITAGMTNYLKEKMSLTSCAVLDGELICVKDGIVLPRKRGNGIITKAIRGTITQEEAEQINFVVWDAPNTTEPYSKRIETMMATVGIGSGIYGVHRIFTETVNNLDEAQAHFERMLEAGKEGSIIKNMDSLWIPKRSKDWCKMKAELEADLEVIGYEEGKGKYKGKCGALICSDRDRRITVTVAGMNDAERKEFYSDSVIGKIVTVRYNEKIIDKRTGKYSLFLPRFIELRSDKSEANTYLEIIRGYNKL